MLKSNNLIAFSDAGRDIDDEFNFVTICNMAAQGIVKLLGVVANTKPSIERARLIKGTLQELGHGHIPVAAGSDVNSDIKHTEFETMAAYIAEERHIEKDAVRMVERSLLLAPDNSVTMLLISGMTDANNFLGAHEDLVKRKVKSFVIMGGVENENGSFILDSEGHLTPDASYNNHIDAESAKKLYKNLQRLEIPTTIVSRFAVYPASVNHAFFEEASATGSRVAKRLYTRHKEFIQDFWRIVNLESDHPDRVDFPARMTAEWFVDKFTNASSDTVDALKRGEPVHQFIERVNLYDVVALMAAVYGERGDIFKPVTHNNFSVIGLSEKENGLENPALLKEIMREHIMSGFANTKTSSRAVGV